MSSRTGTPVIPGDADTRSTAENVCLCFEILDETLYLLIFLCLTVSVYLSLSVFLSDYLSVGLCLSGWLSVWNECVVGMLDIDSIVSIALPLSLSLSLSLSCGTCLHAFLAHL